jgi:tyrosyl-tRNA synthetase
MLPPGVAFMRSTLLSDLHWRGLIADVTTPDELDAHLSDPTTARRTMYVGFDPTADSLHVGSLLPLLTLRRVQLAGHRPLVLVGGGTGLIGDPSGKAGERALNPKEQVAEWAERLKRQVRPFLDFEGGSEAAILEDNYRWLGQLDVISFLRDVGKHFPVGAMMARESVRARMSRGADAGISYTEFSYQVLQAYDFMALLQTYDCTVQLGGTDQWGNITAGTDLIRRVQGRDAYGLTLPLITKADGTKFGKTETGTVWLDPQKTSAYEMYQFWLNTADADVVRFLRFFTFLGADRIAELERATATMPERREAQRVLAHEVTALVHGTPAVAEAQAISAALFSGDVAALDQAQLEQAFHGVPTTALHGAEADSIPLADLLVKVGLADSKRNARELVTSGAIYLNGQRLGQAQASVSRSVALFGRYLVLRKGRKSYHVVTVGAAGNEKNRNA